MVYQPFGSLLQQYKLDDFRDLGFVARARANEIFLCPHLVLIQPRNALKKAMVLNKADPKPLTNEKYLTVNGLPDLKGRGEKNVFDAPWISEN